MKSTKYLDELAAKFDLKNDNQIAVFMGWRNGTVTNYRKGRRIMDNEACLAIALKLEVDPMRLIMAADIDRAERAGEKSLWEIFSLNTDKLSASFKSLLRASKAYWTGFRQVA